MLPKYWFVFALTLAWLVAYFAMIRPWLVSYRYTAGIMQRIRSGEQTTWAAFRLKLRGLKTVILLFATSVFTGGFHAVQSLLGLDPTALAPFQDSALYKSLLGDEVAIKTAAVATLAATVLLLRGKLRDVKTVPQPDPSVK